MSYFRRFLIVSVCGVVQIFFASYVLLELLNNLEELRNEYSALRYYKLNSARIFSMQDWSNWNLVSANRMIYQIAAFAWMVSTRNGKTKLLNAIENWPNSARTLGGC